MSNLQSINLKELFNPLRLNEFSKSVNAFNQTISNTDKTVQNFLGNLAGTISALETIFKTLNINIKDTSSNLISFNTEFTLFHLNLIKVLEIIQQINEKPATTAGISPQSLSGKTGSAGGLNGTGDPLTDAERAGILKSMEVIKNARLKAYLNFLADAGIIVSDIGTDGIAGLPLSIVKDKFNEAPDEVQNEEGIIRGSTNSEGPKWVTESERERTKKIIQQISDEQAKQILTQTHGVKIPIYDKFLEERNAEGPGNMMIQEAWMRAADELEKGNISSNKAIIDYAKTLFTDMYQINTFDNLLGKYQSILTQDDVLKSTREKYKTPEQKLEDSYKEMMKSAKPAQEGKKIPAGAGEKEQGEDVKYHSASARNAEHNLSTNRNTGPGPLKVFEGVTGEAQKIGGALTTIMQTLNIGADTFVGGIINGFNSALSIIQTMITVMQAVNTIKMFLPFATGGSVPGIGDTDSVPAMLTPGEYVVKKSVVNKFGSGFFEWINGGGLTNSLAGHYAGGGMVAAGARQMVAVSIPDVKIKGSDLYLSWRRENNTHGRRSI